MSRKILIVSQHFWPEDFRINDIARGFVESGVDVDILCGIPNYPEGKFFSGYSLFSKRHEKKDGINIYRAIEIPRRKTFFGIFLNYISFPFFALFTIIPLLFKNYDRVLCYQTSPVLMIFPAFIFAKLKKIPLVTYVLDIWPENLYSVLDVKSRFWQNIAEKVSTFLYRKSDRLITMSSELRNRLAKRLLIPREKIAVFAQHCEDIYADNSYPKSRFEKPFRILFAGNFSPAQGLDVLLETAVICKNNLVNDVHFIMLGDGISFTDFSARALSLDVLHYFSFMGKVSQEEVARHAVMADALFASLSKAEFLDLTVPAKISSYMALARPILCCLSGAAAAAVNNADCGFCSEPEDALSLYNNLIKLKKLTRSELKRLSLNAKKYHLNNFSREYVLPRLVKFVMETDV